MESSSGDGVSLWLWCAFPWLLILNILRTPDVYCMFFSEKYLSRSTVQFLIGSFWVFVCCCILNISCQMYSLQTSLIQKMVISFVILSFLIWYNLVCFCFCFLCFAGVIPHTQRNKSYWQSRKKDNIECSNELTEFPTLAQGSKNAWCLLSRNRKIMSSSQQRLHILREALSGRTKG